MLHTLSDMGARGLPPPPLLTLLLGSRAHLITWR